MKPFAKVFLFAFLALATLTMGCATDTMTTGGETRTCGASADNTDPNRVSQGTQGDSLKACLSRIPCDASAGQRQVATLTCERDEKARASIDAVPGK